MEFYQQLKEAFAAQMPHMPLLEDVPLHRYTTFRIGGPARLMAVPRNPQEAATTVSIARQLGITPFFLGNGSNLLVADGGYDGLIIATQNINSITYQGLVMTAGAGALLAQVAQQAQGAGLSGLEFAHGIPGSVGGGVVMNAGAYGGELCQVVQGVNYVDEWGEMRQLTVQECDFSYRHSVFSHQNWLVVSVSFVLTPGKPTEIREEMNRLMAARREKQPLEFPSGGSTFKRPEGQFAAALIDQCGLKGAQVGGAQVSEKHAGFVVNRGDATCGDVLALMAQVKLTVLEQTGVTLEPELQILT